jgi:hypothetical protein
MSDLDIKLKDIAKNKQSWRAQVIQAFNRNLDEDGRLVKAFEARQSIGKKSGAITIYFPEEDTPIGEIRDALKAIDDKDTSVYVPDERMTIADHKNAELQRLRAHMPTSVAMTYDAAAFYAMLYIENYPGVYSDLIFEYESKGLTEETAKEISKIAKEMAAVESFMQEAIVEEIIKREHYKQAKQKLMLLYNDKQLPDPWKTEIAALLDGADAEAIDSIHHLIEKIEQRISEANALGDSIRTKTELLIANPFIDESDRAELKATLTAFESARNNDTWDIVLEKGKTIEEMLARKNFSAVKAQLQQLVDEVTIPDELKRSARELLNLPDTTANLEKRFSLAIVRINGAISEIKAFCRNARDMLPRALEQLKRSTAPIDDFEEKTEALLNDYDDNADTSTLSELKERATKLNQEAIAIQANIRMQPLREKIKAMHDYGNTLPPSSTKRQIVMGLADSLDGIVANYLATLRTAATPTPHLDKKFEQDVKNLLVKGKTNRALQDDRAILKPILINILIALLPVVSFFAMVVKAGSYATDDSGRQKLFKINDAFFSRKSQAEQLVDDIESELPSTRTKP